MPSHRFQGTLPIRDIRRRDSDSVRQSFCIDSNMPFDTRHFLPGVIPFIPRRICILDTLRINDQKAAVRVPTMSDTDRANLFFLRPAPAGFTL
jgi:hypothetical protein